MKRCPFCAEEIQDAAVKCRFCNSNLPAQAQAQAAANAPVGYAAPHAQHALPGPPQAAAYPHPGMPGGIQAMQAQMQGMAEPARVLFEGSPTWRAAASRYAAAAGIVVFGIALGSFLAIKYGAVYGATGAALALGGGLWLLVLNLVTRSRRVRITSQTIDIESGVFGKSIHTLQLWRINDIDYAQSFGERLMGVARIHILSQDEEEPELTLKGLPGSRVLFESLKDAIAIARQSRNVMGVVR